MKALARRPTRNSLGSRTDRQRLFRNTSDLARRSAAQFSRGQASLSQISFSAAGDAASMFYIGDGQSNLSPFFASSQAKIPLPFTASAFALSPDSEPQAFGFVVRAAESRWKIRISPPGLVAVLGPLDLCQ
jgi:hypothetical protein